MNKVVLQICQTNAQTNGHVLPVLAEFSKSRLTGRSVKGQFHKALSSGILARTVPLTCS